MKDSEQMELPTLTLSADVSPAKTYLLLENAEGLMQELAPGCGLKYPDLLAKYDPDTSSWRTSQRCFLETTAGGFSEYLETWPKSGMTVNGTAYRLETLMDVYPQAHRTEESGSGLWPTPAARDYISEKCTPEFAAKRNDSTSGRPLPWVMRHQPDKHPSPGEHESGNLNPAWVCWLMGLPLDYLDLDGWQNPELEGLPPVYLIE